jgi:hypothetical protein
VKRSQQVLDYIAWIWHCEWVNGLCDSPTTAMAVFDSFRRSASAERGRYVEPRP